VYTCVHTLQYLGMYVQSGTTGIGNTCKSVKSVSHLPRYHCVHTYPVYEIKPEIPAPVAARARGA
jgi:hypothetical protein